MKQKLILILATLALTVTANAQRAGGTAAGRTVRIEEVRENAAPVAPAARARSAGNALRNLEARAEGNRISPANAATASVATLVSDCQGSPNVVGQDDNVAAGLGTLASGRSTSANTTGARASLESCAVSGQLTLSQDQKTKILDCVRAL